MILKEWFISIDSGTEGPYSIKDLRRDRRLTPETFVWKEGFDRWKKIRDVPELRSLFFEEEAVSVNEDPPAKAALKKPQDELVLEMRRDPPYLLWILIVLIILLYVVSQLYWSGG